MGNIPEEVLLALAAKGGGGGGGGTTNYNALDNKPQIGGVTLSGNKSASDLGLATETALADKANKADVKNEFIGTLDEWNELTTAQQKEYDTYQITDDYSEALMPNYSTVEQKTGQKWIDGKDIYFRTFTGVSIQSNTSWTTTGVDISYVETIVNGVAIDNAGQVITNSFGGTSGGVLLLRSQFVGNTIATVTLFYTKKTA